MKRLIVVAIALMVLAPRHARAQEPTKPITLPASATEAEGLVPEPDAVTRVVLFADRQFGKGDLTNGIYLDYQSMIPGAGWAAVGPGYRHWYGKDTFFVDASASISVNSFKMAQARAELPKFMKSRLALGAQLRWQDFPSVAHFGLGPDSSLDTHTAFGVKSQHVAAYATLRPIRSLAIGAQAGLLNPQTYSARGFAPLPTTAIDDRKFELREASATLDTRDFEGHPTRGVLLRAAAARYNDRTSGVHDFDRRDAEVAAFVPIAGARVVFAVHGWAVDTRPRNGGSVPFYLQPNLGGANTLRGYTDYRFRDNAMAVGNAELRFALMSHIDWALFADAGNVASRAEDLDLARRSFGTGIRLHTRRETFVMLDAAKGDEGWAVWFRMNDPLRMLRLTRRTTAVPFVP